MRRGVEQRAEALDRARRIAEALVLDGRELGEERRARLRRRLDGEGAPERLRERLGLADLAERRGEAGDRLPIVGGEVEQPLPRVRGAPRLARARGARCGAGTRRARRARARDRRARRAAPRARRRARMPRRSRRRDSSDSGASGSAASARLAARNAISGFLSGPPYTPAMRRRSAARAAGSVSWDARASSDLDHLRVLALGREDRLEERRRLHRGGPTRAREVLERGERGRVPRHLLEHRAVAGQRAVRVREPLVTDAAEPVAQLGGLGDQVRAADPRRRPPGTGRRRGRPSARRRRAAFPSSRARSGPRGRRTGSSGTRRWRRPGRRAAQP